MDTKSNDNNMAQAYPVMVRAVRRILYPLVHLLLKVGISFPQLAELLKEIYIDVADTHFRLNDKAQTQTRLSFLTGIHRKDVKRLHKSAKNWQEPENINVGVKLVSLWTNHPHYQDQQGKPLLLPLKAKDSPNFEELVQTICKQDIRPRVILDEWLNLGVVTLNDPNQVQLCHDAFIPKQGFNEKAFFVGHNIADHLSAVSENLLNESPEFFERCVYYDGLSDESIVELQKMVEECGMDTLKVINERAMQLKLSDMTRSEVKQRINIGLYLYHEHEDNSA